MLVNWQKGTSPSHFLRNPTFCVIPTAEWLLSKPQTTDGENDFFGIFNLAKMGVAGLTC